MATGKRRLPQLPSSITFWYWTPSGIRGSQFPRRKSFTTYCDARWAGQQEFLPSDRCDLCTLRSREPARAANDERLESRMATRELE
jgi:hypothetical protein